MSKYSSSDEVHVAPNPGIGSVQLTSSAPTARLHFEGKKTARMKNPRCDCYIQQNNKHDPNPYPTTTTAFISGFSYLYLGTGETSFHDVYSVKP